MSRIFLQVLIVVTLSLQLQFVFGFNKICYYSKDSFYRKQYAFSPADINPTFCSHIIYSFGKIEDNTIKNADPADLNINGAPGLYYRLMKLKEKNADLKIMLSIGGPSVGSYPWEQITKDQNTISTFATNAIAFLRKFNFDGLDIHWDFPMMKKTQFTNLLEGLSIAIELDGVASKKLLLSAALGGGQATIDTAYEIPKINKLIDFANILTYDLRDSIDDKTGFHTALYSRSDENDWEKTSNVDWTIKYFIGKGLDKAKIMLGLAFYGMGYTLADPANNALGSPITNVKPKGQITGSENIAYFEICSLATKNNAVKKWNDEQKSTSIQLGSTWIGFDDDKAIDLKVEYAITSCLGGIMVWALDLDDFKGQYCGSTSYPLMSSVVDTINKTPKCNTAKSITVDTSILEGEEVTTATTDATTVADLTTVSTTKTLNDVTVTTPVAATTTVADLTATTTTLGRITAKTTTDVTTTETPETNSNSNEEDVLCNSETELLSDMDDCSSFYVCLNGFEKPLTKLKCPDSTWFDVTIQTCVSKMPKRCAPLPEVTEETSTTVITTTTTITETFTDKEVLSTTGTKIPIKTTVADADTTDTTTDTFTGTTTTITDSGDTQEPGHNFPDSTAVKCPKSSGLYPIENDCSSFLICSNDIPHIQACPSGLVFNKDKTTCDYKSPQCPDYDFYKRQKSAEKNFLVGGTFICPDDKTGLFPNIGDPKSFWNCAYGVQALIYCPGETEFNAQLSICDHTKSKSKRNVVKRI